MASRRLFDGAQSELGILPIVGPVAAGVTADLSATLGALALSADATITQPSVTADLSATLAALTLSSDATVASAGVTADLSATLAALSLSADATITQPSVTADLAVTLAALTLAADATITQPAITADLTATLGEMTLAAAASSGIVAGGGASARRQRGRGWAREREILEQSLRQINESQIQGIARAMADSDRPQAQRIARKLIDYSGEVAQIESLRRELAKLEAAQQERTAANLARQQYDADVQAAAAELRAVLRDDDDAMDALELVQRADTVYFLGVLGMTIQ